MSAAALLLLALAPQASAVDAEWRVRQQALRPELCAEELRAAASSTDWRRRAAACEALRRAVIARSGGAALAREVAGEALGDPHASVRELALSVLAELGPPAGAIAEDDARRLAADALPQVRAVLALAAGRGVAPLDVLDALLDDGDDRVRDEARTAALVRGDAAQAERLLRSAAGEELRRGLEVRRRAVHLALADAPPLPADGLGGALRAAFAAVDPRDPERAGAIAAGLARPGDAPAWELAFLVESGGYGGEPLGRAALRAYGDAGDGADLAGLLALGRLALGAERALELLAEAGLGAERSALALEELGPHADAWRPEWGARWLDGRDATTRGRAVEALSRAWTLGADAGAGELLAGVLRSGAPEESEAAFRALCRPGLDGPLLAAVAAHWRGRAAHDRVRLLRYLPRDVPLADLRGDLLELGRAGGASRSAVLDLLEPFRGDAEVARALEAWLEQELGSAGGERAAELRVAGILRALHAVGAPSAAAAVRAALRRAPQSEVIGKLAVDLLGPVAEERAFVESLLAEPWALRTRLEAAIALAPQGSARAAAVLEEELDACPRDLGARAVAALAGAAGPAAAARLERRVLAADSDPALRREALRGIADHASAPEALRVLEEAARTAPDADTAMEAARLLAQRGAEGARALEELWGELERAGGATRLAGLTGDERRAVRGALLTARARCATSWEPLAADLLAEPLAESRELLVARQRGDRAIRPAARWSAEIEALGALAERAPPPPAALLAGDWHRLDGHLLLELARAAARPGSAQATELARALHAAARVALSGEPRAEDEVDLRSAVLGLELAARAEDLRALAEEAERLVEAWVNARVSDRAWRGLLGEVRVRLGADPPGRLAALALQSRARVAWSAGDADLARELARAAAALAERTPEGRLDQRALERLVGEGGG